MIFSEPEASSIPPPNGFPFQNVTVAGVKLSAGVHVLHVTMSNANFNLDYIDGK